MSTNGTGIANGAAIGTHAEPGPEPAWHAGTRYAALWGALSEQFDPKEIKNRPQGNTKLYYVTARTVMNRLDSILGPENWWDDYKASETSVACKLSIRLPSGEVITKMDAGGYAGMSDDGDDDKSGYSDAFKRAAVKFGVGRFLYRDGVPDFRPPAEHHAANHDNKTGHGSGAYAKPVDVDLYKRWLENFVADVNAKWIDYLTNKAGTLPPLGTRDLLRSFQVSGHLMKWARDEGMIKAPEKPTATQYDRFVAVAFAANGPATIAEAEDYGRRKWKEARIALTPVEPEDASQELPDDDDDPDIDMPDGI